MKLETLFRLVCTYVFVHLAVDILIDICLSTSSGTFQVFVPLVLGLDPGRLLRFRQRRGVPHRHHLVLGGGGVGVVEHLDKVAGEDAGLAVDHPPPPTVLDLAQQVDDVLDLEMQNRVTVIQNQVLYLKNPICKYLLNTECVNSSVARFARKFLCKFLWQFSSCLAAQQL